MQINYCTIWAVTLIVTSQSFPCRRIFSMDGNAKLGKSSLWKTTTSSAIFNLTRSCDKDSGSCDFLLHFSQRSSTIQDTISVFSWREQNSNNFYFHFIIFPFVQEQVNVQESKKMKQNDVCTGLIFGNDHQSHATNLESQSFHSCCGICK